MIEFLFFFFGLFIMFFGVFGLFCFFDVYMRLYVIVKCDMGGVINIFLVLVFVLDFFLWES